MKKILLLLFLVVFKTCFSQTFFERTYGRGKGNYIEQSLNGNYIIGADTGVSPNQGGYYFLINNDGDTVQSFFHPTSTVSSIHQIPGGFIFLGDSCCPSKSQLIKTDASGNEVWVTSFPTESWGSYSISVQPVHDHYFVCYGDDGGGPENFYHVLKIDTMGIILKDTVVNTDAEFFRYTQCMNPTSDSGVIVTSSFFLGLIYLTKLNADDSIMWTKEYFDTTGITEYYSNSVIQTHEGGYLVAGHKYVNSETQGILIKTDVNGDSIWSKTFADTSAGIYINSTIENSTGQLYIAGNYVVSQNNISLSLAKIDSNGITLWTKYFSGYGRAYSTAIVLDSAENPMIVGYTTDTSGQNFIYLVKVDTSGNITSVQQNLSEQKNIILFPNPFHSSINISSFFKHNSNAEIIVYDMLGKIVFRESNMNFNSKNNNSIDLSFLKDGIYILEVTENTQKSFIKIIKN